MLTARTSKNTILITENNFLHLPTHYITNLSTLLYLEMSTTSIFYIASTTCMLVHNRFRCKRK